MKIVAINGSPKGINSNTNVIVSSLLKGAQEAGAETVNILLAEKEIKHCKGCHSCWFNTPGQCVIKDDMMEVLSLVGGANIIILATPIYFENISGMLKVFMDRLTMTGNPHSQENIKSENQDLRPAEIQPPKLMMISNCGFPDKSEFEVVSHWFKKVVLKMHTEIAGEIYVTQGKFLTSQEEKLSSIISSYINHLEKAGKEIATNIKLSESTKKILEQNFIIN